MTLFTIELTSTARKSLKKLSQKDQVLIYTVIETLKTNPTPPKSLKLHGRDGYRIRIGDLRLLYTIQRGKLLILIIDVGHRREVYR